MTNKIFSALPAGYFNFHENEAFNFQLNRFYSFGVFGKDELTEIGSRIDGFETWIRSFRELGEEAEKKRELLKAATCYRAAQFYTLSGEKDEEGRNLKSVLYEKCRELFNGYYSRFEEIKYTQIPFENYKIPVYYVVNDNPKGTIVMHGGYDSIAQEFLLVLKIFSDLGYDVYFFEGPGQGEVLMHYDVRMTEKWEHCTGAVLDHFQLEDVTLIGISLGGYLAPRAAAYEKRITRVVMFDLIYDFYGSLLNKMGDKARLFDYLVSHPRNILWRGVNKKLKKNYFTNWLLKQGYAIYENVNTPYEYFNYIKRFNTREISGLITQDVLVLAGEADIYTVYYDEQIRALKNARSVTGRLFTKEEHADHHCQIGNMGLVLQTVADWIEERTDGEKTGTNRR
ncbi:MAG: alpha/beta hydrolase [Lachnospiraceae bacterium]|nr:alpha/beta hydrolase [Lachnospiraceae bacterium]